MKCKFTIKDTCLMKSQNIVQKHLTIYVSMDQIYYKETALIVLRFLTYVFVFLINCHNTSLLGVYS